MKQLLKNIGISIIVFIVVAAVASAFFNISDSNSNNTQEDTYMGITRQEYLDKVSNNGQDTAARCVYANLIDQYGLKETYQMDYRASVDENDVDQRIFDEMKVCS